MDALRLVDLVEGHIEPFHQEACAGLLEVALRKKLCNRKHLLPLMEMVNGLRRQCLGDVVVAAGSKIDVLPVPGLLFVKSFLEEKLNLTTKIFSSSEQSCSRGTIAGSTGSGK